MGAAGQVSLQSEPRVSRIFISYASQDLPIAPALANAFRIALGDVFAEINIDKWFLQAGDEFKKNRASAASGGSPQRNGGARSLDQHRAHSEDGRKLQSNESGQEAPCTGSEEIPVRQL